MPHDSEGTELKIGDRVMMEFTVTQITPAATACNVTLQAIDEQDLGEYKPLVSCNARLTRKR